MTAEIHQLYPPADETEFDGGDGDGPEVIEIRITFEDEPFEPDDEPDEKQPSQVGAFVCGALFGWLIG